MTRGRKLSPENDRMLAMYESGMSCSAIAKRVGIGRQAVWEALKRRGCRFRPSNRIPVRESVEYKGDKYYMSKNGIWRAGRLSLRNDPLKANLSHRAYAESRGLSELPPRAVIAYRDGDHRNFAPENLVLTNPSEFAKTLFASLPPKKKILVRAGAIVGHLNRTIAEALDPERAKRRHKKIRDSRMANGSYDTGARKAAETKKRNGTYAIIGKKISESWKRKKELAAGAENRKGKK